MYHYYYGLRKIQISKAAKVYSSTYIESSVKVNAMMGYIFIKMLDCLSIGEGLYMSVCLTDKY